MDRLLKKVFMDKTYKNTEPEFYAHWTEAEMVTELSRLNKLLVEMKEDLISLNKILETIK